MKKYKAILFDMDGTLVPMDMKVFVNGYFKYLCKKLAHHGIPDDELIAAVWAGTAAMVENDGSKPNEQVFWDKFGEVTGVTDTSVIDADCIDFYGHEFNEGRQFTKPNPLAPEAIRLAHEKAPIVVLATNPLFPMAGQITRMNWVGLAPDDFDLVTCYESDYYCKPNPQYFTSVCERIGVEPADCLMIGNDENEDAYAATKAGMDAYIIDDCMIPSDKHPWKGPRGSFTDMLDMLRSL